MDVEEAAVPDENLWIGKEGFCFLEQLFNYINFRFITCVNHCLICDRDLEVTGLKIPVCKRSHTHTHTHISVYTHTHTHIISI